MLEYCVAVGSGAGEGSDWSAVEAEVEYVVDAAGDEGYVGAVCGGPEVGV